MNKPKPDNRLNNVERLQEMKENTKQNIEAAVETMTESDMSSEQKKEIKEKNERRKESIQGFEAEMADEIEAREQGYRK